MQKFYFTSTTPASDVQARWFGMSLCSNAATTLAVSASDSYDAKKNLLKVLGATWAVAAAQSIYNAEQGHQKKDVAYGIAAGKAVVSALCLWRGFKTETD